MFYVWMIFGFIVFTAGLIVIPGLWKLAWVAACVVALAFVPSILAAVLDPLNARRIRSYCAGVGATDVEIQPFPNHYGVRFRKHGQKHYAKCTVVGGRIAWKGTAPADIAPSAAPSSGN